jgi:site-specific DNA-methyltransferase (adenine-specific)
MHIAALLSRRAIKGKTRYNHAMSETVKLSTLIPDGKNANLGSPRGNQMIEDSLRQYGAGRSILLDKHGRIIAGNKTAENAGAIGMEDVLVVQSDGTRLVAVQRTDLDLDDPHTRQLAIADNRSGQVSLDWDSDVLKGLVDDGVDLAPFWTADELAELWPVTVDLQTDEDAVPPVPEEPKSKLGDLYVLGEHRLLCGDSTIVTDVERLMGETRAICCWTDPPYNVAIGITDVADAKARNRRTDGKGVANDAMDDLAFREFITNALKSAYIACEPGSAIYVCHADSEGYNFRGAMVDAGWLRKQCLIWVKSSLVMGRQDYQWMHEPILYGWKPGAAHRWCGDRCQTTVLKFDKPSKSPEHPTMKPVALIEYCLSNSAQIGTAIFDPFGGSGSTLIACEKTRRRCFMMELSPAYCDVIVTRWEQATGKKAVLSAG